MRIDRFMVTTLYTFLAVLSFPCSLPHSQLSAHSLEDSNDGQTVCVPYAALSELSAFRKSGKGFKGTVDGYVCLYLYVFCHAFLSPPQIPLFLLETKKLKNFFLCLQTLY